MINTARKKVVALFAAILFAVLTATASPAQAGHDLKIVADPGVIIMKYGNYHVPKMSIASPDPDVKILAWSCTPWIQSKRMVVKNVLHDPLFGKPYYRKQQVAVWDVVYGYGTPRNHLNTPDREWAFDKKRIPGKTVRSVMTCAARLMVRYGGEIHYDRAVGTVIGPERIF